jgi:diguanylate cyclase (GGDEF)-like protein/PAS domain S-box-containing protein
MNNFSAESWRSIVETAPEGIVVCDAAAPDFPVVYANEAFAQLCGYPVSALLGNSLRMLQGSDRDQEARQRLRDAFARGESCRVLLRNYRPDGAVFWNEMLVQPFRDASGAITHWIGYHRDASERLRNADRGIQGLPSWLREDRLTGLHSRQYFEELLHRDWTLAQRDSHEVGLMLFDIDNLAAYNGTFDRSAGDACIRRVSRVITGSFRRGSDLVGRWEGGGFAVLTQGDSLEKATEYANVVVQRTRELLIHHPRAGHERYVTVSAGVASIVPPRDLDVTALLNACKAALQRAKSHGKNRVIAAQAVDFTAPRVAIPARA